MDRIRDWLRRRSSQPASSPAAGTSGSDLGTRTARADHIIALRAEVSRLQQERLALSNAGKGQPSATGTDSHRQMATIERGLDRAQRELAKLQGRI